jgi:hypothetical protein
VTITAPAETPEHTPAQQAAHPRRRRVSRTIVWIIVLFVATRAIAGFVADRPSIYGSDRANATGDADLYDYWTWSIRHEGASVYGTLHMEYPPAGIPFMEVPRYIRAVSYRAELIMLMIAVDAVGLWGLVRLARHSKQTGVWWGVGSWLVLVPLLGPVSYTRLDLVVAASLVWAFERAARGKWGQAGALIGLGAAVKVVPLLLLPVVALGAPARKRLLTFGACIAVCVLAIAPFARTLPDMYKSIIDYHTERGVQAESVWGSSVLAVSQVNDYAVSVVSSARAFDIESSVSSLLKTLSNGIDLVVLGLASIFAFRTGRGDVRRLSLLAFATMSLLVGLGRVYSPQYLLWLVGLGAVALTYFPRRARVPIGLLTVCVVLAHILFPFWYYNALIYRETPAITLLVVRDFLTIGVGVAAFIAWLGAPAAKSVTPPGEDAEVVMTTSGPEPSAREGRSHAPHRL